MVTKKQFWFIILISLGIFLSYAFYSQKLKTKIINPDLTFKPIATFNFDTLQNIALAKNKPLLLYFTGHNCINCKKFEYNTLSTPNLESFIQRTFQAYGLYVDDKTLLAEEYWIRSHKSGRLLKTLGDQIAEFQINTLNRNTQPLIVMYNKKGKVINMIYNLKSTTDFIDFLKDGEAKYKTN